MAASRLARGLAWSVALLMALQSSVGLLVRSVYRDDAWVKMTWVGNDLVTLFVAVPLLVAALVTVRRGSLRAELVAYSMLAYATYNAGFYLFGARLNALFPLYALLFVLPVLALIVGLAATDVGRFAATASPKMPVRPVAGYMAFTGVGLTIAWLAQWAAYIFGGTEPSIGPDEFQLVAAMDLTFMVPFFLIGAVLLWRRRPWGFVIAPVMTIKGATYTLVLTVNSFVGERLGFAGSIEQAPVWGAWTLAGVVAASALLRNIAELPAGPSEDPQPA